MNRSSPLSFLSSRRWQLLTGLGLGLAQALGMALTSNAAEQITISYGAIERSVHVADLALFADQGVLSRDLQIYARYFDPESLEQFRQILNEPAQIDVVVADNFLHSTQGDYLLDIAADIIRTGGRRRDRRALRGAILVAASEKQLTLLNVIRHFPSPELRVDLAKGFAIARELDRFIYQTNTALSYVEQLAAANIAENPLSSTDAVALSNATNVGAYGVEKVSLQATIPTDVYLPQDNRGRRLRGRPAVVISHGLGGDRTVYGYLATHLASHGLVAIAVEHPGSSAAQLNAVLVGDAASVIPDTEFLERPRQISGVLDDLEALARRDPSWRGVIDFNHIGVFGQSLGGYTALTLAGAPLNFPTLDDDCPPQATSLNVSLLLQCQASVLRKANQGTLDLSDRRIQAVMAVNPITSVLFGQDSLSQIAIPTLIVAGGIDTVAPALSEQIFPFTWLAPTIPQYLVTMPLGTHFSTIGPSANNSEVIPIPPSIIGPRPDLAEAYTEVISLIFFNTYLANQPDFKPLLSSAAIAALSERLSTNQIPLNLIQSLSAPDLKTYLDNPPRSVTNTPTPAASPDFNNAPLTVP